MERRQQLDLTDGPITGKLVKLALPIMATSFIQMGYNLTDMAFIGRQGSDAVAAVGTAGYIPWFAMSIIMISKAGTQIKVSQSTGMKNENETKRYIKTGIQMNMLLAIIFTLAVLTFHNSIIGFFKLGDEHVINLTRQYLLIISLGFIPYFMNPLFTSIFNGSGDSHTPFMINAVSLVTNIVLDWVLIFGVGPFPKLNVAGAAIATITAQYVASILFILVLIKRKDYRFKQNYFSRIDSDHSKVIVRLGLPIAIQEGLFSIFAMFIARIVAPFGPVAIAVQKVGSQIESISWMTSEGFSTALSTYVGQNFGAKKYNRIAKGYRVTMTMAVIVGIFATVLLVFGGHTLFKLFINEPEAIELGTSYLRILGLSQLFMCIEITTAGAFNGLGKTEIPSVIGVVFTGARIPAAIFLSSLPFLGINGVWWSISMSSVVKGLIAITAYYIYAKRKDFANMK